MKTKVGRMPGGVWLCVACLGLLLSPLSAREPKPRATFKGHTAAVTCVAASPDGKTLASGSWDKTVILWDVAAGKERATLTGHTAVVHAVAFSPDGKTLASGSQDKAVILWDVAKGRELATLKGHAFEVHAVAFRPDGKTLASG